MIRAIGILVILTIVRTGYSQIDLDTSSLPEQLLADANVVVRETNAHFNILSTSKATYHVYQLITILNPNGNKHAWKTVYYDKLTKIKSLRASIFGADGSVIGKFKSTDFDDYSAISGYSLYEDNRVKTKDLSIPTYPFTIEIEYELEFSFLFFIPPYYPQWDENMSTLSASYRLTFPVDNAPRFLLKNIVAERIVANHQNGEFSWTFNNLPAIALERQGPDWTEIFPAIQSAPTYFEFEGYKGKMDTWQNFGNWIRELNRDRGELDQSTKLKIQQLTNDLITTRDKTQAIYNYLQNRTRYVSIQLGIGGFQPLAAKTVDNVGYGDCKALSNYMIALLKEVGITSYYTLIKAGGEAPLIDINFPSSQFNHVIVMVPDKSDTLWLECTSQTNPFNYLGRFTDDRFALAVSEKESRLIKTPRYRGKNSVESKLKVTIGTEGQSSIELLRNYSGLCIEKNHVNDIALAGQSTQKKWLEKNIELPTFKIENFSFSTDNEKPSVHLNMKIYAERLGSANGKRLFITPNVLNRYPVVFSKTETRKTDVIVSQATIETDTIEFELPESIYPEFIPSDVSLITKFGEYHCSINVTQGKLIYIRKLIMMEGRYSSADYNALCDFNKEISKSDNVKIAFLRKT